MHEIAIETGSRIGKFMVVDAKLIPTAFNLSEIIQKRIQEKKRFFGIEVSPVPSNETLNYNEFEVQPAFTSITWLLDHNVRQLNTSDAPALQLASVLSRSNPILSHISCYKMNERKLSEILSLGVNNVLALRGDIQDDDQPWKHAIDLVREIRRIKSNVSIAVAAYPETNPDGIDRDNDLQYLKEKIDAGADFIVTNVCFSIDALTQFIRSCRSIGITVPIIPGIFVPASYTSLKQMCRICKVTVPDAQMEQFRRLRNDSEAFKNFSTENAEHFLTRLFEMESENVYGIHFFTLNKYDNIYDIIKKYQFE